MNLQQLADRVDRAKFEYETARRTLDSEKSEVERLGSRLSNATAAQGITQTVAREVQRKAYGCIAGIVTKCLQSVFDEPYTFTVTFESKRNKTEVALKFERDGKEVDPMAAAGGGVVDIAAFALRLASLILMGGAARRILVLDEPFRFLSAEYRDKVRDLLLLLSSELGIQIVMVTHIRELEIGKLVSLE